MFGQSWDNAEATIVDRHGKFTGDGSTVTYTYAADVRLASGETFRATIREPTIATNFWPPDIRDVVSVLVGSKDRKVKFDKDDERLSVKAHDAAKRASFQASQQQPAGATTTPSAPSDIPDAVAKKLAELGIAGMVVPTTESRLAQLTELHDRGVLTAEEYAEQRQRILDQI